MPLVEHTDNDPTYNVWQKNEHIIMCMIKYTIGPYHEYVCVRNGITWREKLVDDGSKFPKCLLVPISYIQLLMQAIVLMEITVECNTGLHYEHGLNSIPVWSGNCIHHKVWDEITIFNRTAVKIWE